MDKLKLGIIGAGQVGSAAAFSLLGEPFVSQVVLVDKNTARAEAEVLDISHAFPRGRHDAIISGGYEDLSNAYMVVITAGLNRKPDQTRLDLLSANVQIFSEIVPQVVKYAPDALLLIASNPVDIMTKVALQLSGLPSYRVFGSGTAVDSARFSIELAHYLDVSPQSIQASIVGEHGDSEVLVWSRVTVAGIPLEAFADIVDRPMNENIRRKIHENVRDAGARIISGKGATFYGIGGTLCRICRHFAFDEQNILMLSTHHDAFNGFSHLCFSSPAIAGFGGIQRTFHYDLNEQESMALRESVKILEEHTELAISLIAKK
jgi:L-lactate dehydrogenase